MTTLQDILKQILPVARQQLKKQVKLYIENTQKEFAEFFDILEKFQLKISDFNKQEIASSVYVTELKNSFKLLLKWTNRISEIPTQTLHNQLWNEWQTSFKDVVSQLPDQISLEIDESDYSVNTEDPVKEKLWKWKNRRVNAFRKLTHQIINKFRTLFKKSPLPIKKKLRKFPLKLFLQQHLALPYANFLLDQSQLFLKTIASELYESHQFTESLKDDIFSQKDLEELCRYLSPEKISSYQEKIKLQLAKQSKFDTRIEPYSEAAVELFKQNWQVISKQVEKNWQHAGTYILPIIAFRQRSVEESVKDFEKMYTKVSNTWLNHFNGEKEDWQKDLELALLQIHVMLICKNGITPVQKKIYEGFIPTFEESSLIISESLEKFRQIDSQKESALRETILSEQHLLTLLRKEKLPLMMDRILQSHIEQDIESYLENVQQALELLSEKHVIFKYRDLESLPPRSRTDEISLKEIVKDEIFEKLKRNHSNFRDDIHQRLENMILNISEIDQIVEFNLEAALNLLSEGNKGEIIDQAREVAIEGLERTNNQLNELIDNSQKVLSDINNTFEKITGELEKDIQELADSEKILELKFRLAQAKTREEVRTYRRRTIEQVKNALPFFLTFLTKNTKAIYAKYLRFRKITGLEPTAVKIEDELTKFLGETESRLKALPYVYQRLFRLEPLDDERFFVGRSLELKELEQQFQYWQNQIYAATAVVGEKGSGKTTLLNFAEQKYYTSYRVLKFDVSHTIYEEEHLLQHLQKILHLPEADSIDDLEKMVLASEQKIIFILENLQNLFLRTLEGFKVLERLMLFISRTNLKIYWIVTCTLYSWEYLNKVLKISKYFQRVIRLGNLSQEEIQNIILKRHRVSGFELLYSVPESLAQSKKYRKLATTEERQLYLQELFFNGLNELASGNITVTMLFWQRAINEVLKDKLIIFPLINFDYSFLYQLPSEDLFTLAAFMQHEILTIEQHAMIFQQDIQTSGLLLNRMLNQGIIQKHPRGLQIHPFFYRAVVRTLTSKNILH